MYSRTNKTCDLSIQVFEFQVTNAPETSDYHEFMG